MLLRSYYSVWGVEGAIQRRGLLLLVRVVERQVELHLLGEEAAEIKVGGHGILVVVEVFTLL